jgi:DNA-binding XRE family transcriptional regulator
MARKWNDIRRPVDPERRASLDQIKSAMRDAMALADLREDRGLTQSALADRLAITRSRVSKIEREDDLYMSTLRRYVEAMGGELQVLALFDGGTTAVPLVGRAGSPGGKRGASAA